LYPPDAPPDEAPVTAGPPPWRVFDAPSPERSDSPADPSTDATALTAAATAVRGSATGLGGRRIRPDVVLGLAAALGGLLLAWLLATGGPGGSIALGGGTQLIVTDDPAGGLTGGDIVVDVVGAVLRPGVYHLPPGSRVGDAIAAAGGLGPRVAADRVEGELNLAAPLRDGDQVVVPSRADAQASSGHTSTSADPGSGGGLIDLNSATATELDSLPGIGPVTAGKIVAARTSQPFRSVDELLERKLVSQKTFDAIKAKVTVGS
jgi:competence protein ComEA